MTRWPTGMWWCATVLDQELCSVTWVADTHTHTHTHTHTDTQTVAVAGFEAVDSSYPCTSLDAIPIKDDTVAEN